MQKRVGHFLEPVGCQTIEYRHVNSGGPGNLATKLIISDCGAGVVDAVLQHVLDEPTVSLLHSRPGINYIYGLFGVKDGPL